jgi:Aspartyl/Asparaginyl beta-hydroxylase
MISSLPGINFSKLEIDLDRFRLDLVTYFLKYQNGGTAIYLNKRPEDSTNYIKNHYANFYNTFSDPLADLERAIHIITTGIDFDRRECDYTQYTPELQQHSPYVIECLDRISAFTGRKFGRMRLAQIAGMTTHPLHVDYGSERLHIPIVTNEHVLYAIDDQVFSMLDYTTLYSLPVQCQHVAVNPGRQTRLHVLIVPAEEQVGIDNVSQARARLGEILSRAENHQAHHDPADRMLNQEYYSKLDQNIQQGQSLLDQLNCQIPA